MYFCFKNIALLKERPEALEHEVFKKIFKVSELLNMDEETRTKVLNKMTTERDLRNQMKYFKETTLAEGRAEGLEKGRLEGMEKGRAEGRAEGRVEGRAEGRAEGKREQAIEIAAKLIALGISHKEVAEITGLSEDDF